MKLLLDTSAFLWLITSPERIPAGVLAMLASADNSVSFSVVSFWEIVVKFRIGKLPLPEAPSTYVPRQRKRHRIAELPLHGEAVSHLEKLPAHHRDPFDRMLVCQAIEAGLTLVTSDPLIQAYPVKTLWQ